MGGSSSSSKYATGGELDEDQYVKSDRNNAEFSNTNLKIAAELHMVSTKIQDLGSWPQISALVACYVLDGIYVINDSVAIARRPFWFHFDRGLVIIFYFGFTGMLLALMALHSLLRYFLSGHTSKLKESTLVKVAGSFVVRSLSVWLLLLDNLVHTLKLHFACKFTFGSKTSSSVLYSEKYYLLVVIALWVDLAIINLFSQCKTIYLGAYSISSKSILTRTNLPTQSFNLLGTVLRGILIGLRLQKIQLQGQNGTVETILLAMVAILQSILNCAYPPFHFPTMNIVQCVCLMTLGLGVLTYHFFALPLALVVIILVAVSTSHLFGVFFREFVSGEQAFLQLRDPVSNFSWLISLDHVKTSSKRSANYMMKAIGLNFGTKLALNWPGETPSTPTTPGKPGSTSPLAQIPQGAISGLGVLGVLGVPVGISGQALPGMGGAKADSPVERTRYENLAYNSVVAEAQDLDFLRHQSLSYFEELEENNPKDPYTHFLKLQWLLVYYPSLMLVLGELEKMESKVSSLKEHIQLYAARQQLEVYLQNHYQMVSGFKRVPFEENTMGAFGWSSEAINKTEFVRHPYKVVNSCKPNQLDLAYVFFYKNKIETLVSRIGRFTDMVQDTMTHLEEKKGEKSKLMSYVRKLYNLRGYIDDYFDEMNLLTQKTDFKHYIPYISHINFNLNLQESARHLLSQYSARQSALLQSSEFKEVRINNTNMLVDNMYLLLSSNRRSFGNIVDVYGNYQLFTNNHQEVIGKHFDMFLTPSIREYHKTFVDIATNESMEKFRLFGSQFSGFVKVPSRDMVVYANTTVKVVPYAQNEFKLLTLVKPLLNIFEDKFFILLDSQLNIEAFSYNFLDILPANYLAVGGSLNSMSSLVHHRVLTLRESKLATATQSRGNPQGGGNVGSSDIFPATPQMHPVSPLRRIDSKTKLGSMSGIHQDKEIYNGSAAMATNIFNFGDFMALEGNNIELEDVLKFYQEGTSKMAQKTIYINICYKPFLLGKEGDSGYYYLVLTLKDEPGQGSRSADSVHHDRAGGRRQNSLDVKDDVSIGDEQMEMEANESSWAKMQQPENKDGSQELPIGAQGTSAGAGASVGPAASGGVGAGTSVDPTGNKASSSSTLQVQHNLIGAMITPAEKQVGRNVIHRNSSGAYDPSLSISNAPRKGNVTQNTTRFNSAIGNIDSGFAVSLDKKIYEEQKLQERRNQEDVAVHESASQVGTPSEVADQGASSTSRKPLNLNAVLNTRAVTRKYDYTRKRTFGTNQKQKLETIGEMSAYERANSIGLLENEVSRKTEQAEPKDSFGSKFRTTKLNKDYINYERAITKPPFPMMLWVQLLVVFIAAAGLFGIRVSQNSFYTTRSGDLSNLVVGYNILQAFNLKMTRGYASIIRAIALNTGYSSPARYLALQTKVDSDSGSDMKVFKSSSNYSLLNGNGLYLKDQMSNIWADLSLDRQELDTSLQSLPDIQSKLLSQQSSFYLPDYASTDPLATYSVTYSIFEGYFSYQNAWLVQLLTYPVSFFDMSIRKSSQYASLIFNYIRTLREYDSDSGAFVDSQYDTFIANYFSQFLYYLISYAGTLLVLAAVLILVLIFSLIHFNGILENIFMCQPHEILEKKKALQKVSSLCQLHRHDNFYFLGTLKDHDLESVSVEAKGQIKFSSTKSKQLYFFGLLRSYIPEVLIILALVVLLAGAALDYNKKYQLMKKYSDQLTQVTRSMKLQVQANGLLFI